MEKYDILIIGGGVAGMSAAIYAKRRGKKVAVIEKFSLGGQVLSIDRIENFPSQNLIDGFSLSQMFSSQMKNLEVEILRDEVLSVDFSSKEKKIICKKGEYVAKSVIIATGLSYVELGKNERDFLGKGVSFCAVCDANFYKNRPVFVASKKGSGIAGALKLAEVCSSVTVLDSEDMSVYAQANRNEKIKVVSNAKIEKFVGEFELQKIEVLIDGKKTTFDACAVFVELGKKPSNLFDMLKRDSAGFIITDENMQTSIEGVYAVGDVRSKNLRQIVTACSDGAIAGQNA